MVKRGGTYTVVVDLGRDANGKRIRKWHSGYRTSKEAEQARTELLSRLDSGSYVPPTKTTLASFVKDRWVRHLDDQVVLEKIRPNTAHHYKMVMGRYVVPRLGHIAITKLTPDMLLRMYGELSVSGKLRTKDGKPKGLSPATVRHVHVAVHRCLRDAQKWGLVKVNVADTISDDAPKAPRGREYTLWTPAQMKAFLEATKEDHLHAAWYLLCTTGLRRGELCGLRWDCVDMAARTLKVARTIVTVDGEAVASTPKTKKSNRHVGLDASTVAVLRAHKVRQDAARSARTPEDAKKVVPLRDDGLVFTWDNGTAIHPDVVTKSFQRLAGDVGLPVIRLHDLRHSYVTAGLEAGVPMKVMSERAGHSSIAITADTYSHVRAEVDQAAADKVAGLILGAGGA